MNKTELKKMKKDDLINLVLTIQNDNTMALELSEMKGKNNKLTCELDELSELYDQACSKLSEMEEIIDVVDRLDVLYDIKDRLGAVDDTELSVGDVIRLNFEISYINSLIKAVECIDNE